jgi:hypothetical protein
MDRHALCATFAYASLDEPSQWLTAGALALYLLFCGYGAFRCYRAKERWRGVLAEKSGPAAGELTSFSRVAAAIGAYFLTSFFIIIGGYIVSRLWFRPECSGVKATIDSMKDFVWAAVALFAPYAANQVSHIFRGGTSGSSGGIDTRPGGLSGGSGQRVRYNPNETPPTPAPSASQGS